MGGEEGVLREVIKEKGIGPRTEPLGILYVTVNIVDYD